MSQLLSAPWLTRQLRQLLTSPTLDFILEAHNGISARVVEEAGFKGIWASGLALSAQFGVRDNNEASWTQVVDMVEFMADVTGVPILLDGDKEAEGKRFFRLGEAAFRLLSVWQPGPPENLSAAHAARYDWDAVTATLAGHYARLLDT